MPQNSMRVLSQGRTQSELVPTVSVTRGAARGTHPEKAVRILAVLGPIPDQLEGVANGALQIHFGWFVHKPTPGMLMSGKSHSGLLCVTLCA